MDPVEEVKNRLDVAEVIGGYIQLKQAGRNLKASCPFHNEKTASFMVSPEKNIWHCFGCGEGGDVFKFVMKMEGLEFREALEKLAQRAGVELTNNPADKGRAKAKERLYKAHELAVKYYQATLVKNPNALAYLKGRQLTKQSLQDFGIGYAPDNWEGLTNFLRKHGFSDKELLDAGLAAQKRGLYDYFRGRIMLPISDNVGKVVGFTGRVLGDGEPKYLNSPQTALYDKSRAIYGLHLAREAIRSSDEVVLVEGNMDVVASHQAGVKNVVAASGTALTLDQLKTLSRLTKNIKLAFDQDAAGLAATERAIELGQKLGLTLKMIEIVGAKDPDELIANDPAAWKTAIKDAKYIVDYLFDRFETAFDLKSAVGKRQYSDRLALNLQRLADPVEQDHYVQLLAEKTGTNPEAVKQKVDQAEPVTKTLTYVAKSATPSEPKAQTTATASVEEMILAMALAYPDTRLALDDLNEADFANEDRRAIFKQLKSATAEKDLPDSTDYGKILTLRGEEEFSSLAPADRSLEAFRLTRRLQILANKKTKTDITKQLREAEKSGDTLLVRTLLEQYQALITEDN